MGDARQRHGLAAMMAASRRRLAATATTVATVAGLLLAPGAATRAHAQDGAQNGAQNGVQNAARVCPGIPVHVPGPNGDGPELINDPSWRARVAELERTFVTADMSRVRVAFVGDSLTEGWYPTVFQQYYGQRDALNLGVRGDSFLGVLWRLARSPLGATLRPRLVVVLIGTNNLWPGVHPTDVASGIADVVRAIRHRSPSSRILLLGLLPRGREAGNPFRVALAEVNALIANCADGRAVVFADPGPRLLDAYGRLSEQVSFDGLHLTETGYAILAAALEPTVRHLLGD